MNYGSMGLRSLYSCSKKRLVWHWVLILAVLALGSLLLTPSSVQAQSGGVGSGGSGSDASGGHQSMYGYGWVDYPRSGPGPTNGFRDGASWSSVQGVCKDASTVRIFIVRNASYVGKGYTYLGWNNSSLLLPPGHNVDNGRAIAVSLTEAKTSFDELPPGLKAGYTWGANVGWFCYGSTPSPPAGTGSCIAVSAPGSVQANQSFSATFNVKNDTSSAFPANGVYAIGSQSPQDNHRWGTHRVVLTSAIGPGQTGSVTGSFVAPSSPGSYQFDWMLLREGVGWYGPICGRTITVSSPQPPSCPTPRPTISLPNNAPRTGGPPAYIWGNHDHHKPQNRSTITRVNDISAGGSRVTIPHTGGTNHSVTLDYGPYGTSYPYDVNQASVEYISYYDTDHYVPSGPLQWYTYQDPIYGPLYLVESPKGFFTWKQDIIGYRTVRVDLGYIPRLSGTSRNLQAYGAVNGPVMQPCYNRGFEDMTPSVHQANFDNNENPSTVTFNSSLTGRYTLPNGNFWGVRQPLRLNLPIQAQYYLIRAGSQTLYPLGKLSGGQPGVTGMPSLMTPASFYGGPYVNVFRATVPPLQAGDRVCMVMSHVQRGTMNVSGAIQTSSGNASANSSCAQQSNPVHDRAYLKTFGGEVMTGGNFGTSAACTPSSGQGGIHTWAEPRGNGYVGASAQLTVDSLLTINEFYSASQRSGAARPNPPKGLTFANTGSTEGNSTYGGGSRHSLCLTDYFNDTRDPALGTGRWNGASLPSGAGRIQYEGLSSGSTIAGSSVTIPHGTQAAVYINGDVFIANSIVYAPGAGSWEASPYFAVIARGNIYISSNVTRLDGLYIAQSGVIYTCASGIRSVFNAGTIYSNCGNQLTVNGGLVARTVRFHRMRGSLRSGSIGEQSTSPNIAEVINYTPEMYLAPSPLKRPDSSTGGTVTNPRATGLYQSIKSLPPIY